MMILQRLSETTNKMSKWFGPFGHEFVPVYQARRIDGRKRAFYISFTAVAVIGCGLPLTSWTADLSPLASVKPGKVVAAGVGYENAETSTITVKTYDAETGSILSEETYELNVREDASLADSQPRERIFAGGVGPGTDGLSAFTLRAYDAVTGKFLWEGLLNLNVGSQESGSTHRVAAYLAPRAQVTQVWSRGASAGQPQFILRAVDPATGQLVWTDQFSAGDGRLAQVERISRAVIGQTEGFAAPAQQIEFRIRMFNDRDRQMLWEDTIEPTVEETDAAAGYNEAAENLPAWRGAGPDETMKEVI